MEASSSFDDGPLGGGPSSSGIDGEEGPDPATTASSAPAAETTSSGPAAASSSANAAAYSAQENVAELQFGGPEFEDNMTILSNAQVAVILQVSATSAINRDEELNEVYRKTQKYVNRFNSMTNAEKEHQELVDELDNLQEYVC